MSILASERELWISPGEAIRRGIITDKPVRVMLRCLICCEDIPAYIDDCDPKICEKCRDAVMAMRKKMEE